MKKKSLILFFGILFLINFVSSCESCFSDECVYNIVEDTSGEVCGVVGEDYGTFGFVGCVEGCKVDIHQDGIDCDRDGFARGGTSCGGLADCDDFDDSVHPGISEVCGNCKDDNCNGLIDCGEASCNLQTCCEGCFVGDIGGLSFSPPTICETGTCLRNTCGLSCDSVYDEPVNCPIGEEGCCPDNSLCCDNPDSDTPATCCDKETQKCFLGKVPLKKFNLCADLICPDETYHLCSGGGKKSTCCKSEDSCTPEDRTKGICGDNCNTKFLINFFICSMEGECPGDYIKKTCALNSVCCHKTNEVPMSNLGFCSCKRIACDTEDETLCSGKKDYEDKFNVCCGTGEVCFHDTDGFPRCVTPSETLTSLSLSPDEEVKSSLTSLLILESTSLESVFYFYSLSEEDVSLYVLMEEVKEWISN